MRRTTAICTALAAMSVCTASARAAVDYGQLKTWGLTVSDNIERTLRKSNSSLYAEAASLEGVQSGGANGRAFVWAEATQFRVLNALTALDPVTYTPALRSFSDQLYTSYWNKGYSASSGGADRYYDDNGHVVVALVEAYRVTHDPLYLVRAEVTQRFVMTGEDLNGGIYFHQQATQGGVDAISTLQGAHGAAMLYRSTGNVAYLNDAKRLLTWANTHIQQSDGLYAQNYSLTSHTPGGPPLSNSAGIAIQTNLELFDATGIPSYLSEAQRLAARNLIRYINTTNGAIKDQGHWAFELVDALDDLYRHDHNLNWINKVYGGLTYLHDVRADPNGFYDLIWDRPAQTTALPTWELIDQASVARAYLYTSMVPEPTAMALIWALGARAAMRRRRFKA
ncbi:MAG: Alpha-l-arabinofuranosidase b (Abfb) family protein [Phycisphaerales bacterium]|nr:Alpha-l-arabinofuranosidase b (Abfb) family protein [Phycisphaerales bacterium]